MRIFLNVITLLLFISINIYSQEDEPPMKGLFYSVGPGIVFPVGDLDNGWKSNLHLGGNAGYLFSKVVGIRLDAAYSLFLPDASGDYTGGSFNIFSLRGDFVVGDFRRKPKASPYAFIGPGAYYKHKADLKLDGVVVDRAFNELELGLALGAGIGMKFTKTTSGFIEVSYNYGFGNQPVSSYVPIRFGIMWTPK